MNEFLTELKKYGAVFLPRAAGEIVRTQAALQASGKIMMPRGLVEFYENAGGMVLGDAEIFGLLPAAVGKTRARTLMETNGDFSNTPQLAKKTIFGRNGLFLLVVGEDLKYSLLDFYTMRPVKAYDDALAAIRDCLLVGAM
ncbi:MAG: hypothetical protein LBG89_01060 [Rickettsiales bacterium]|jgi:hypothetical protein|nr:hypothetical protein [Rickettsiales bacterium]